MKSAIRAGIAQTIASHLAFLVSGASAGPFFKAGPTSAIVCAVSLVFGLYLISRQVPVRRRFFNRLGKRQAERRRVLVLTLSENTQLLPTDVELTFASLKDDLAALADSKRLAYTENRRASFWRWEQPLRAIQHHCCDDGPLERVVLLGSPESIRRSHIFVREVAWKYRELRSVEFFVYLQYDRSLRRLGVEDDLYERHAQNGVDFEDFDTMTRAYDDILERLNEDHVRAKDVQIDFTAGQKPASVVGAVITLFSNASNQYVATNPRDQEADVWVYDIWGYDFREISVPKD